MLAMDLCHERSSFRWSDEDQQPRCRNPSEARNRQGIGTEASGIMAKSSKLVAVRRGKVLLVRRRRDRRWMFPGGRKRARENEKDCLRREIREELPKLKLGHVRLWKEVKAKNRHSGRKMSDAIFVASKATGNLTIGDKKEIDRAVWRKPRGIRLTPTSRYVRGKLFGH
jgi:8-oxo-dGTP diphosphatase